MARTARPHHVHSVEAYLALERISPSKHEFANGTILAMAGGSLRHNRIETMTLQALGRRLDGGPCFPMTSNQRIATADGLYTYADGSVFCGEIELGPEQTARNPVVLVEVLSDSTRAYDTGEKLERYRTIPSLGHVLLVEQAERRVVHWRRTADGWADELCEEFVRLLTVGIELTLDEIYDGADRFAT